MPFDYLLDAFWVSFGCLLAAFWMAFGTMDVPAVYFGEFVNFKMFFGASPACKPHPILTQFLSFCLHGGGLFFVVFLGASFSNMLQF